MPPAWSRYLRPVSVRLCAAERAVSWELPLPLLHVPPCSCRSAPFLVASICVYQSRTPAVSRYLRIPPPLSVSTRYFRSLYPGSINTYCNVFLRTYNQFHEGLQPLCNKYKQDFGLFALLLARLNPATATTCTLAGALQKIHSTAKGRVKARRDATFVAAKPDQAPKPLTGL